MVLKGFPPPGGPSLGTSGGLFGFAFVILSSLLSIISSLFSLFSSLLSLLSYLYSLFSLLAAIFPPLSLLLVSEIVPCT